MKQFISFSGGVESSTMCVLFGDKANAIFADTGFEHQQIYDRIELVEKWVQNFHRPDFKIHKVKNEKYGTLPEYIKNSHFYPNFKTRYCTRMFKIEPIDNYLKQFENEGAEIMIGLNADEVGQRTGAHGLIPFVKYSYPLVDNGLNRSACIAILKKVGLYPEFPPYMKRGGCIGCYYKSDKEYLAMAAINPEEFKKVQDIEEELNEYFTTRNKFFSIKPTKKMADIKQEALSSLFKPEEVYATINDATKCGVFCNR
jgi:PP-loop superfamily ATP-utilizing enzyme